MINPGSHVSPGPPSTSFASNQIMSQSHKAQQAEWRKLLEDKTEQFKASNADTFALVNFDDFTQYLQNLNQKYRRRGWSRFISRFQTSLKHIRSFEKTIAAMTQASEISSILWGGIQMVMEVKPISRLDTDKKQDPTCH